MVADRHPSEQIAPTTPETPCSRNGDPQKVTLKMFFLSLWVSWAATISSFDNGFAGTVLIMPSYQKAFGHCETKFDPNTQDQVEICDLNTLQQSLISISILFIALGCILSGFCGSKLGRRGTIQVACVFCVFGAAGMLGTSGKFSSYIVCKCISGVGIGQLYASSVVYGSECVVASKRGLLLGIYNIGLALGNLIVAAVCAGSATLGPDDDWQWKTPIVCQIPLAVTLGFGMFMFPESPRWLLSKGKDEAARVSFASFLCHDPHSLEVKKQMEDVQQHLDFERSIDATTSWVEIYRGNNLRRTAVSALILIGLPITGIQFVAPYAALFLKGVGINNPYLINAIIGLCIFAGAFTGPLALDYGGRRLSITIVVAFLCIWAFIFGGLIGSSTWLASAEMHSIRLRTYGQANTTFLYGIFAFGAAFWTPYMLNPEYGNMGVNVGYFYFGVTVGVLFLTFLFVPETSQLTLEQIDDYFVSNTKAWSTSTKRNIALSGPKSAYDVEQVEASANSSSAM
ncbi:mfs monosaccharide transporter protein [Penicillium argentinense]|uniref:Mfs monosaccharide transporter protein n=1 Tax=Penicillium argentinense TaxID=1131581 RepID=A0A9W9FG33_9EURO|nr:mfs monosaccharide transporter protein [Penicillium argentinense]KAJ5099489.1 mfs monosaccharide transporter protein [Penicillium argentinense]